MELPADMDIKVCKRDERWTIGWTSSDGTSGNAEFFAESAPELTMSLFQRIIESHDRNPSATATPEYVECQTCNDFRQVFASRDVERPELDRWYACPDCTTPENVDGLT